MDTSPLPPLFPADSDGWTRARIIFLSISSGLILLLLFFVREVLLPFALAITLAYVVTPLVELFEKRFKFSSGLAVVVSYAILLVALGVAATTLTPRLYSETVRMTREAPRLLRETADHHGPKVDNWVNAYLGESGKRAPEPHRPAFLVQEMPDGTLHVELGRGVEIVQESDSLYRLKATEEATAGGFRLSRVVSQGLDDFSSYVAGHAVELLKFGQAIVGQLARSILLFFMVLMVSGYLIHTRYAILRSFRALVPPRYRADWDYLLRRVDRGFSGVVRGQLLICVVNGLLSAIGFWLFDLKYWPVLSLIAAGFSIIPVFGAILSSVPAVAIGLTQGLSTGLWVLVWILGIHQIEANILNPKIIGAAARLHPALVVFALLTGEHYFGLWGALLAVPVLSLVQSIFNHFRHLLLSDAGPDSMSAAELARVTRRRLD
jgi:predicted PurR-regulated permease PerM